MTEDETTKSQSQKVTSELPPTLSITFKKGKMFQCVATAHDEQKIQRRLKAQKCTV